MLRLTYKVPTLIACEAAAGSPHFTGVSFTICTRSGTNDATNELRLPPVIVTSRRRQPCTVVRIGSSVSRVVAPPKWP